MNAMGRPVPWRWHRGRTQCTHSQSEIRIEPEPAGTGEKERKRGGEEQELELPPAALGTRSERGLADPHGREGHHHVDRESQREDTCRDAEDEEQRPDGLE